MLMHYNYTEIKEIAGKIDCFAFQSFDHFTSNPVPPCITYSQTSPRLKTTKTDIENQERIKKTIQEFITRSRN